MTTFHERIENQMLLKADIVEDLGLFHGKMGIALAFAEYGKRKFR